MEFVTLRNKPCLQFMASCLRRLWHLPPNSHRDTISALGSDRTMFDELCHWILKFVIFCLSSWNCNSTVSFIVRNSLSLCRASSPLGRKFMHISHRYRFPQVLFVTRTGAVLIRRTLLIIEESSSKKCVLLHLCF